MPQTPRYEPFAPTGAPTPAAPAPEPAVAPMSGSSLTGSSLSDASPSGSASSGSASSGSAPFGSAASGSSRPAHGTPAWAPGETPSHGRRSSGALAAEGTPAVPRRSAVSAVSAVSAYSPVSPVEPPRSAAMTTPPAERSPFAPPLPGEEEAPTITISRREIAESLSASVTPRRYGDRDDSRTRAFGTQAAMSAGDPVESADVRRSRRAAARTAGRRATTDPAPSFDLSRARTLLIGLAATLALLLGVGGVAYLMSRPGTPISISISEKPLALPDKAGDYTREAAKTPSLSQHSDGRTTLTATYERGGKGQFVVLASRPEKDAVSALEAALAVGVQTAPGGACGRIGQQTACAVMASKTTALVGVTQVDQTKDELLVALRRIAEAMA